MHNIVVFMSNIFLVNVYIITSNSRIDAGALALKPTAAQCMSLP